MTEHAWPVDFFANMHEAPPTKPEILPRFQQIFQIYPQESGQMNSKRLIQALNTLLLRQDRAPARVRKVFRHQHGKQPVKP